MLRQEIGCGIEIVVAKEKGRIHWPTSPGLALLRRKGVEEQYSRQYPVFPSARWGYRSDWKRIAVVGVGGLPWMGMLLEGKRALDPRVRPARDR
jgi:hypothetical protein